MKSQTQTKPIAIYHAFDQKYTEIQKLVPLLVEEGYTHVQTSPASKSRQLLPHTAKPGEKPNIWWLKYQPVEFTIGNSYGTSKELKDLVTTLHENQIKIIVDVQLNFMSALQGIERNEWDRAEDLATRGDRTLLSEYEKLLDSAYPPFRLSDYAWPRTGKLHGKKRPLWFNAAMPALNTHGFRFDTAIWTDLKLLSEYFGVLRDKDDQWRSYSEIIERTDLKVIKAYQEVGPIMDFRCTLELINAFKLHSSLLSLENLEKNVRDQDVTFSVNHDTFNGTIRLFFEDREHVNLATAVLLTIKAGVPLIFSETAKASIVKEGLKFRKWMTLCNAPASTFIRWNSDDPNVALIARGSLGFCVINKGLKNVVVSRLDFNAPLLGRYFRVSVPEYVVEISNNAEHKEIFSSRSRGMQLSAKSCLFFVYSGIQLGEIQSLRVSEIQITKNAKPVKKKRNRVQGTSWSKT